MASMNFFPEKPIALTEHEGKDAPPDDMRAAVFAGPRQVRIERVPRPQPGPAQVRVRVEGCGLCASNLGPWGGGPWYHYPMEPGAPGHEAWGMIDALGAGVRTRKVGDRVAVLSQHAYGQYDIVPEDAALPLPESLGGRPFPGEPLACAMNIFARSLVDSTHTVAIVGIGFLGALLTQLCAATGARVLAVSRRPYALEIARRCGAGFCIQARDPYKVAARILELTGGRNCERVIEAVGMQSALDLATELTGTRARLIIAGYHQDGARTINMQQWNWRGLDVVNAHEREAEVYRRGLQDAIEAVRSGLLDPEPLLTHVFPLEELPQAFRMLQQRPEGFLKAWIRPWK